MLPGSRPTNVSSIGLLASGPSLRACLSVRFQGFTPSPQYRPSASSRLWPARPAALCLPDPCGLGSDSHGGEVFSGKLLGFLTQTGSKRGLLLVPCCSTPCDSIGFSTSPQPGSQQCRIQVSPQF